MENIRNIEPFLHLSLIWNVYYVANLSLASWFSSVQIQFGVTGKGEQVEVDSEVLH